MWDTPSAASNWLKTFAINNEELLKETNVNIYLKKKFFFFLINLFSFVQNLLIHGVLENQHQLEHIFLILLVM